MNFFKYVVFGIFTLISLTNYSYAIDKQVDSKKSNNSTTKTPENNKNKKITEKPAEETITDKKVDLSNQAKERVNLLLKNLSDNLNKQNNLYDYFSLLVNDCIALEYTTAWVLGGNYKKFTASQRQKYTELGRDYLIFAYGNMLAYYYKQYNFEIKDVVKRSERNYEVTVLITAKPKDKTDDSAKVSIPSIWVLSYSAQQNRFFILDMVINNISLLQVQRASFADQIKKVNGNYDEFIVQLSKKVDDLKSKGFRR